MLRLLFCVVICCVQVANLQETTSDSCKGTTIIQNFWGDQVPKQHHRQPVGPPLRGPPGKRGPVGPLGPKGLKGELGIKGQKGESPVSEILELQEKLDKLDKLSKLASPASRTCDEATNTSGYYIISPLESPFKVYCEVQVIGNGTIVKTLIGHDSENETSVGNCEAPRCYKRDVTYHISMRQIIGLIDASQECRQFIKYRCVGSHLRNSRSVFGVWNSRQGVRKTNWGGSERDNYCACGETASCIDNYYKCNCDQNVGGLMTSDEGYLTNKDDLPVTGLQFGDTGDKGENGWHTLGKLECWGRA